MSREYFSQILSSLKNNKFDIKKKKNNKKSIKK